jgi:hypothetical protein
MVIIPNRGWPGQLEQVVPAAQQHEDAGAAAEVAHTPMGARV